VVRLGVALLPMLLALASGCTGEIQSQNLVGLPITEQLAQQAWVEKAMPILGTKCLMCHDGSMPNIGYIAGEDDLARRETLVSYVPRVVNLTAPASSRMLTKGAHTGPALDVTEANDILIWIRAESKARPNDAPPIRTAMYTPTVCPTDVAGPMCPLNMVDLSSLGVAGTLEFAVQQVGADSYYTQLKVKAGAEGIYLEHPLFESYEGGAEPPKPDPIDRYFATTLNLMANTEAPIGTGTASLTGFNAADPITIRFDVVEKYRPGT
jgi:hypothetical protein